MKVALEIENLLQKIADDYSRKEYERYVKQHPDTKKTPSDPMFKVKKAPEKKEVPTQGKQPAQQPTQPEQTTQGKPEQPKPEQPKPEQPKPEQHAPQEQHQEINEQSLNKMKGFGKKIQDFFKNRKEAVHNHIKKEVKELKTASEAIKKFVNKEELSSHEKQAVEEAAKKVATALIGITLAGHVDVSAFAQHIAVESVADATVASSHDSHDSHKGLHIPETHPEAKTPINENNIAEVKWKNTGNKFLEHFKKRKEAVVKFLKNQSHEFKTAGKAISKFVAGEKVNDEEVHALKNAAKEVATSIVFATFGGHFGALAIVQAFAISTIAQAFVSKSAFIKEGNMKTARDPEDEFIEMIVKSVVEQLNKLEHKSPQELRELAKQIENSVRRDPKIKKELAEQFGKK